MIKQINIIYKSIAIFFMAMLFFSCTDTYRRVGDEAKKKVFPVGVAENFTLTYTETKEAMARDTLSTSRVIAVLAGPVREDYQNLSFPHQIFPEGLLVDFFDDKNQKSIIKADYGIIYSATNLIDLQGNVVLETHDGKKLEAPQLFYDQDNEWVFTQKSFKFTNPEEGTVMNGEGMDFNKELSLLNAHKVYGLMMIKEEIND